MFNYYLCKKPFAKKYDLKRHWNEVHVQSVYQIVPTRNGLECIHCDAKFGFIYSLVDHNYQIQNLKVNVKQDAFDSEDGKILNPFNLFNIH